MPLLEARPLRQKAPGDLTLTCRILTPYRARSPVRTRWGQRVKAGQSPPGGWGGGGASFGSSPRLSFFQRGGDSRIIPNTPSPPEAWDSPRAFKSGPARQAPARNPACRGADSLVCGAGRRRSGGEKGTGSGESQGPLPLELLTQTLVLAAQGV